MPYPDTLDDLTTAVPTGGSTDHEEHTLEMATAIEALETVVGITSAPGVPRLLADPGATWQPVTAYAEGDRIKVADLVDAGLTEVFEAASTGTSGDSEPSWAITAPLATTPSGSVDWVWQGRMGTVGFAGLSIDPQGQAAIDLVQPLASAVGPLGDPGKNTANAASGDVWTANGDGTAGFLPPLVATGTDDPTADGGIGGAIGALYTRDNSGTGELWVKTGSADDAWTQVV